MGHIRSTADGHQRIEPGQQRTRAQQVAVDLWGSEVVCTRCKVTRCETKLQEGCTCAAAGGTWKRQSSKTVMQLKLLQTLLEVTLQHEGTSVAPPPEYFVVHAHESPLGHPSWHEKSVGSAGGLERGELYGRVVLQIASSQQKREQPTPLLIIRSSHTPTGMVGVLEDLGMNHVPLISLISI